jgi:hypothetical protein
VTNTPGTARAPGHTKRITSQGIFDTRQFVVEDILGKPQKFAWQTFLEPYLEQMGHPEDEPDEDFDMGVAV